MSNVRYYDKICAPIEKARWLELSKDPAYSEIRVYDNGHIKAVVRWLGKVVSPENMDREYWPLFALEAYNWNGSSWSKDPNYSGETGTVETAIAAYEEFLLEWSDSTTEDDGKGRKVFVEADDNVAALPEEPDRNTPESDVAAIGDDGAGVW